MLEKKKFLHFGRLYKYQYAREIAFPPEALSASKSSIRRRSIEWLRLSVRGFALFFPPIVLIRSG